MANRRSPKDDRTIEDADVENRLKQLVKTKLLLLQIAHSPTATPAHRRVPRRTALTRVQNCPLLLDPVNALGQDRVRTAEAIDAHRQIISDQQGDR